MSIDKSIKLRTSRYVQGGNTETANDILEWWDRRTFGESPSDMRYVVENKYEGRLDLIANAFYGEPSLWWLIGQYNNILDPIIEVVPGTVLIIPTKDRVTTEMLNRKLGGSQSQRSVKKTLPPVIV